MIYTKNAYIWAFLFKIGFINILLYIGIVLQTVYSDIQQFM